MKVSVLPVKLDLTRQGVLLIGIYLAMELLFLGGLAHLYWKVENENSEQELARLIVARANHLLIAVFDSGDATGDLAVSKGLDTTFRFEQSSESIPQCLDWLKKNLEGSESQELLGRIEKNISYCLPVMNSLRKAAGQISESEYQILWREKSSSIRLRSDELRADLIKLTEKAHSVARQSPRVEREIRSKTRKLLLLGLLLNVTTGILLIGFFSRRIVGRVERLLDATGKLASGAELPVALSGVDELSELDEALRKLSARLIEDEGLRHEQALKLKNMIDTIPMGLIVLGDNGVIESFNGAVESMTGYASHELLGKSLVRLLFPRSATVGSAILSQLSRKALGHTVEIGVDTKYGEELSLELTMASVDIGGKKQSVVVMVDAQERKRLREEKRAFVSMISHELRDPLTYVGGFIDRLIEGEFGRITDKARDNSSKVTQNIDRMIILLSDLFDLDKLESGNIDIEPKLTNLTSLVDKSLSAISVFAQKHHVRIDIIYSSGIENPESQDLYIDANRIVQVLINLLSNAIKYSYKDGQVKLHVESENNIVTFKVIDSGRGIPPSHLDSVFERYQQVESSDAKKKGGTGLGLSVCKSIVEGHGGNIAVESVLGKGSTFWFRIPRVVSK